MGILVRLYLSSYKENSFEFIGVYLNCREEREKTKIGIKDRLVNTSTR